MGVGALGAAEMAVWDAWIVVAGRASSDESCIDSPPRPDEKELAQLRLEQVAFGLPTAV